MKRNFFVAVLLIVIAGAITFELFFSKSELTRLYSRMADELDDHGLLDRRFDGIVDILFNTIELPGNLKGRRTIVNRQYDSDSLCIYVVNRKQLFSDSTLLRKLSGESGTMVRASRENFVAVPPNVILIDGKFLSFLMLSSYNHSLAFAQTIGMQEENDRTLAALIRQTGRSAEDYFENGELQLGKLLADTSIPETVYRQFYEQNILLPYTLHNLEVYLRYGNLSAYRSDAQWFSELDSLGPMIAAQISSEPKISYTYQSFFAVIIYHELAHLTSGDTDIHGWTTLEDLLTLRPLRIQEEERADDAALKTILAFSPDSIVMGGPGFVFVQSIIAFAETMRDFVLVDVFDGFRGLNARDILLMIQERYPLPEDLRDYPFQQPARIERTEWNRPPAITRAELKEIIARIRSTGSSATHQHLLLRAARVYESISTLSPVDLPNLFHGYEDYLLTPLTSDRAAEEIANKLRLQIDSVKGDLGISRSQAMYLLDSAFMFEEALPIGGDSCWIGYSKNMTIELRGKSSRLTRAMFLRHYRDDAFSEQNINDVVQSMRFLFNVAPEFNTRAPEFLAMYTQFMEERSRGMHPWKVFRFPSRIVYFGQVNESATFQMFIAPPSQE